MKKTIITVATMLSLSGCVFAQDTIKVDKNGVITKEIPAVSIVISQSDIDKELKFALRDSLSGELDKKQAQTIIDKAHIRACTARKAGAVVSK